MLKIAARRLLSDGGVSLAFELKKKKKARGMDWIGSRRVVGVRNVSNESSGKY